MARLPRFCPAGMPVHIMQRGINRQACFVCDEDDQTCLRFLIEGAQHYGTEIHGWVWMTNPVHLLATPKEDAGISRMMPFLGKCDVCYFNPVYRRTGRRWEDRFKSCVVDTEGYFLECQRYIEFNPVTAGRVKYPMDYRWASDRANALGRACPLTMPGDLYMALGVDAAA